MSHAPLIKNCLVSASVTQAELLSTFFTCKNITNLT